MFRRDHTHGSPRDHAPASHRPPCPQRRPPARAASGAARRPHAHARAELGRVRADPAGDAAPGRRRGRPRAPVLRVRRDRERRQGRGPLRREAPAVCRQHERQLLRQRRERPVLRRERSSLGAQERARDLAAHDRCDVPREDDGHGPSAHQRLPRRRYLPGQGDVRLPTRHPDPEQHPGHDDHAVLDPGIDRPRRCLRPRRPRGPRLGRQCERRQRDDRRDRLPGRRHRQRPGLLLRSLPGPDQRRQLPPVQGGHDGQLQGPRAQYGQHRADEHHLPVQRERHEHRRRPRRAPRCPRRSPRAPRRRSAPSPRRSRPRASARSTTTRSA